MRPPAQPAVAIVADDLTGAADCGVQFARSGYRTAVLFQDSTTLPEADALALDAGSRELGREGAAGRTTEATGRVRHASILYKKLDSTLRGNVAAELGAALETSGRRACLLAPAFPEMGRTTREGTQVLHGEPLPGGHLPTLLERAGLGPVEVLAARARREDAVRSLARARWIVADAEEQKHLEHLVRCVRDPASVLWAGSAGLARALGSVHPGPRKVPGPPTFSARRVLVVVGSTSATSREQLDVLKQRGLEVVPLAEDATDGLRRVLTAGRSAALCSAPQRSAGAEQRISAALARVVVNLAGEDLFDALVLTGGETARRIASALGARGILLRGEVEPGVPAGTLIGDRPYPVVTKAGGFGGPETLWNALLTLTGGGR